jgi:ABC-type uncharacterized transport system fused permease/ATPase subunit
MTNVSIPVANMLKNSWTLAVSVAINISIKLCFVSVNGSRETYFVDEPRKRWPFLTCIIFFMGVLCNAFQIWQKLTKMRFTWQHLVQITLAIPCLFEMYSVVLEMKHAGKGHDFPIMYEFLVFVNKNICFEQAAVQFPPKLLLSCPNQLCCHRIID